MANPEGTSPLKRVCLTKEELEQLSKEDLIEQWLLQEKYINSLELKSGEVENSELVSLRESEEKLKQQQLEATRRENILVMRLTTKEQEMQEYASQIQELKQSQVPTVAQLRAALLDPAVNLVFERMRKEVDSLKARLEETQNELSAWKFTPDSNTGKRLMAKCRSLYQENEELGKMISAGRLAKLEGDLALQRNFSEEMKKSQTELDEFLLELDEDVEGMQSTIIYLQQKLKEAKEQLAKLQEENNLLSSSSNSNDEPNLAKLNVVKSEAEVIKTLPEKPNATSEHASNNDLERTNGDKSPPYSLAPSITPPPYTLAPTISSPRTPTQFESPLTPEPPEQSTMILESSSVVPRLSSPRTPEGPRVEETLVVSIRTSVSTPDLPSTPEPSLSPDASKEETVPPQNTVPPVSLEKPNVIQENGLKQGVICYGHQSLLVGGPTMEFKRESAPILVENPSSPINEVASRLTVNNVQNQYVAAETEPDRIKDGIMKMDTTESIPLDLVKKPNDFITNHSPISSTSSVVVGSTIVSANLSNLNSTEQPLTNVIVRDNVSKVPPTVATNELPTQIIVPKLRLMASVQRVEHSVPVSSPSPPHSPKTMMISLSPDRKRTRPLSDEDENTNSALGLIKLSPKRLKLAIEPTLPTTLSGAGPVISSPSSPPRDKTLMVDIDTEVQVAQTLACWAVASSKERTHAKSPNNDQMVNSGLMGNGDLVGGAKLGEGQS